MKKIMNFLMQSCQKAAGLIDKKMEIKLAWKENVQLHLHTPMCNACSAYEKQSKLIDETLQRYLHNISIDSKSIVENRALKNRITSKL